MEVLFECDPIPRGGYRDHGVKMSEPQRPMLQPNYAGDATLKRRSVPASVRGTAKRIRLKIDRALQASAKCWINGHEIRRAYWYRIAKRWMQKQSVLNQAWPELLAKTNAE